MFIRSNYIAPDPFDRDDPHSDSNEDEISPVGGADDIVYY